MENEVQNKSSSRKSLTLSGENIKRLKTAKEIAEAWHSISLTWDNFISHLCLSGEITMCKVPMVKADRVSRWVYQADCPECHQHSAPLRRKGNIVWGVNCEKCGKRFIAVV